MMAAVGTQEMDRHRGQPLVVAMTWLPADEYAHVEERWPDIAAGLAGRDDGTGVVSHADYCQRIEAKLCEAREAGMTVLCIAPLRWSGYATWLRESPDKKGNPAELRAQYAADLAQYPSQVVGWPPRRNEPCWCGSGRKYKQCCAAPGATEVRQ